MYDILCLPKSVSANKIKKINAVYKKKKTAAKYCFAAVCAGSSYPAGNGGTVSVSRCQLFLECQKFVGGIIPEVFLEVRTECRQMRGEDHVVEREERRWRIERLLLHDIQRRTSDPVFFQYVIERLLWGRYLYYNIVAHIQSKKFSIFYNDDINIIKSWFPSPLDKRVDIRWQPRSEIFNGLSATKIREAIINDDQDYLTQYLPQPVLDDVPYIKRYLIKIKNHPLPDFSME